MGRPITYSPVNCPVFAGAVHLQHSPWDCRNPHGRLKLAHWSVRGCYDPSIRLYRYHVGHMSESHPTKYL